MANEKINWQYINYVKDETPLASMYTLVSLNDPHKLFPPFLVLSIPANANI